jgi:hypothetical protein
MKRAGGRGCANANTAGTGKKNDIAVCGSSVAGLKRD